MRSRLWMILLVFFFVFDGYVPLLSDTVSPRVTISSAQAAPSAKSAKKKSVRKAPSAKKKAVTKRRRGGRRGYRSPAPVLPDDPSKPLGKSLEEQLNAFFKVSKPAYGSFVAIDPVSGEVLAASEWSSNRKSTPHPATSARFPAASVFKVITAAALLENTAVTADTRTCYSGGLHGLEMRHIVDSKKHRKCVTLTNAFAHSTNAVFGKQAIKNLSPESLVKMAERFGFNHGLRLGDFTTGTKARTAVGDLALARMAAGFTNSSLSPVHGAIIAAVIANGGHLPTGLMVDGEASSEGRKVISADTAASIRRMMVEAAQNGTGRRYFAGINSRSGDKRVAVKTGTLTSRDGSGLHNTWMVGFYPANNPEIAFAGLISQNGYGPLKAGHVTKYAIETYLKLKKSRSRRS